MSQFRENLRTDGRTDTPYFIGLFWPRPRVQKWFSYKKTCTKRGSNNYSYFQNLFTRILNKHAEVVVQRCSVKKVFLEILSNSQENTWARVSFLISCRLWHRCFPVNFAKFLRTPFFMEHLWWLLLNMHH